MAGRLNGSNGDSVKRRDAVSLGNVGTGDGFEDRKWPSLVFRHSREIMAAETSVCRDRSAAGLFQGKRCPGAASRYTILEADK